MAFANKTSACCIKCWGLEFILIILMVAVDGYFKKGNVDNVVMYISKMREQGFRFVKQHTGW